MDEKDITDAFDLKRIDQYMQMFGTLVIFPSFLQTIFACTFCFPNSDHMTIPRRFIACEQALFTHPESRKRACSQARRFRVLSLSLKRVHADILIFACTLLNVQDKGSNLLRVITWSVMGKQNVQADKVWKSAYRIGELQVPVRGILNPPGSFGCGILKIIGLYSVSSLLKACLVNYPSE